MASRLRTHCPPQPAVTIEIMKEAESEAAAATAGATTVGAGRDWRRGRWESHQTTQASGPSPHGQWKAW